MNVSIIGCGNLGHALAKGMLDAGIAAENITATRRKIDSLADLAARGVRITSDNRQAVRQADVIIMAVKPYQILDIIAEVRDEINPKKHILVSVATSISLDEIRFVLDSEVDMPIFRAMPNTAADIRESITCVCQNDAAGDAYARVEGIFRGLGPVVKIDEKLMEAATILGACGIAYVMRFMRAMVQGGIQIGFSADIANAIVQQTVKGASELLLQGGAHPESEIDKVTTPKGCTIVGLNEMEHNGFSSSLIKGIVASYEKIARD